MIMSDFLECQSCGEHCMLQKLEEHIKEAHFWN